MSSHSHVHYQSNQPVYVHSQANFTNKRTNNTVRNCSRQQPSQSQSQPHPQPQPPPLHIAVPPPPSGPPPHQFQQVMMTVPPPFHLSVHQPPPNPTASQPFTARPPPQPPAAHAPPVTTQVQYQHVINSAVHMHHGHVVTPETSLVNGITAVRPINAYFSGPPMNQPPPAHHLPSVGVDIQDVRSQQHVTQIEGCQHPVVFAHSEGCPNSQSQLIQSLHPHIVTAAAPGEYPPHLMHHRQLQQHHHIHQQHSESSNMSTPNSVSDSENQCNSVQLSPEPGTQVKVKTPMCLVNELARHNKICHLYTVLDESGPSHKKVFTVRLKMGDVEEYMGTGHSIRKAQHAAAAIALEKTKLRHPPCRAKPTVNLVSLTPTVALNSWATRIGHSPVYTFIDNHGNGDENKENSDGKSGGKTSYKVNHHNTKRIQNGKPSQNGLNPDEKKTYRYKVSLKMCNSEFIGEGITAQKAKHAAASQALEHFQFMSSPPGSNLSKSTLPSFVPTVKPMPDLDAKDKSPVSLVHESAFKRNLTVKFEVTKESGPAHIRHYITRCSCGDFVTEGGGNCKRLSKREAATLMLEKLKTLPPVQALVVQVNGQVEKEGSEESEKKETKKKAESKKRKGRNLIKLEQKADPEYGQNVNPISRLMQIQQGRRSREPEYVLVSEKGSSRRRVFVIKVQVDGFVAQGSGPNKKLAKRAAAEAALQLMGYSPKLPGSDCVPSKPLLKTSMSNNSAKYPEDACLEQSSGGKRLTFSEDHDSGEILEARAVFEQNDSHSPVPSGATEDLPPDTNHNHKVENVKAMLSMKIQLSSLAEVLGIEVIYRHINKRPKNDSFISLVKLSTSPPKVYYGSGSTLEQSEQDAAAKALIAIADSGLEEDFIDSDLSKSDSVG